MIWIINQPTSPCNLSTTNAFYTAKPYLTTKYNTAAHTSSLIGQFLATSSPIGQRILYNWARYVRLIIQHIYIVTKII